MNKCRHCRLFRRSWHCGFYKSEPPCAPDDIQCGNFIATKRVADKQGQ
ncbi:MAG: hypothetical protein GOU99_00250 [Candidatus Altiarchaeota archaeon]|nr:hypothetical protein [Candidatus Altiarchaeota archaeon]